MVDSVFVGGGGVGNWNVRARPASVAELRKGMVKRSMPSEIWRRMWCGEDGSSRERRGRRERAVVAGMSARSDEE